MDDTALYRKVLSDVVQQIPGATVLGTAFDGRAALERIERTQPDLVLLDVEMPNLNGLQTLKVIRERWPLVGVVMVSGTDRNAADITIQALEHGAIDFVPKPVTRGPNESRQALHDALVPILRTFRTRLTLRRARADVARRPAPDLRPGCDRSLTTSRAPMRSGVAGDRPSGFGTRPPTWPGVDPAMGRPPLAAPKLAQSRPPVPGEFALVAIGVSTGGPQALTAVIPALSAGLVAPVVIVQHMPPGFTASLAAQLDRKSSLSVAEASEGTPVVPGSVLIAPGGHHMTVRKRGTGLEVGLSDAPPVKSCRPSVDVLFRSLVGTVGGRILTVVLTGMGDDGADGVQALMRQGSYNLAQDEATCVVYGMPRAVAERQLAHEVLPVHRVAARINEIVTARAVDASSNLASALRR